MTNLPPGAYTLRVSAPCTSRTYEVTVEVPRDTFVVLAVDCPAPQSPSQIPPVQVPSIRRDSP